MTRVREVTREELERRKQAILSRVAMTYDELAECAEQYSWSGMSGRRGVN